MVDQVLFEEIVNIRRDLHRHPETGFDVERTAALVAEQLTKLGLKVRTGVGKTGVVADLEVPNAKSRIAFRADMDALPIQEERDSPYKSTIPGKAHLCGHDAHTAMLIGLAKILSRQKPKTNVRFIFQPSEEISPGGAPGMIAEGCLEGVDAIYAVHVWPWLDTGTIGICPGPVMAQADSFDIMIHGRGGHAAAPHQNIDPIIIGSNMVTAFQSVVAAQINPLEPAVLSITKFLAGSAYNVIPSKAHISGTVRTYSPEIKQRIKQRMGELIQAISKGFGAESTFTYQEGYPPVINHLKACETVSIAGKTFLLPQQVVYPSEKAMFGEDFAYYLEKVPGCFIQLGCNNTASGCIYPLHHPSFNLDEECMKVGMQLFTQLALLED